MASLFDLENLKHQGARYGVSMSGSLIKRYLQLFGIAVIAPLVALMDVWDYLLSKNRITSEYANEIGAVLGKPAETVDAKDMVVVAKENPTIGEALKRAKRKRNMDMAINVSTSVATFFIVAMLLPHIGVLSLILAGAVGFGGFIMSNYVLEKIGNKLFGLSEPSLKKVEFNPTLQEKLSLPSQVKYLEHLQKRRVNISASQITILFNKAEREIHPDEAQMWASKLNDRVIDATEMAFIVNGQRSGVPERESPQLSQLERVNAELRKDLAIASGKLKDAGSAARDKAGAVKDKTMDFAGSVKDKSAELGGKVSNAWQTKVRRNHNAPDQSHTEAVLSERQRQAQAVTPPL